MKTKTKQILTFYFCSLIFLLRQMTQDVSLTSIFREINLVFFISKNVDFTQNWWITNENETDSRNMRNKIVKSIRNILVWVDLTEFLSKNRLPNNSSSNLDDLISRKKIINMPWPPQHVNSHLHEFSELLFSQTWWMFFKKHPHLLTTSH